MKTLPGVSSIITDYLRANGITEHDLWKEYNIANLHDPIFSIVEQNKYLQSIDDSGTPCFVESEYLALYQRLISSIDATDVNFVDSYLAERLSQYNSPRKHCKSIALRGNVYYSNFLDFENSGDYNNRIKKDLLADISFYNICQRNRKDIPREFVLMVVDHIKSVALKVMHGYVVKSLADDSYFDEENWNYLDSLIKSLWEGYARLIFNENGKITGTLSFNYLLTLLDEVEFPFKIKELDSAKNLLRFAVSVQNSGCVFDTCMSLLFGGVEIPYALHGFMSVFPAQSVVNVVPAIFSLNRMVKGEIPRSILDGNGLIEIDDLKKIIPSFFLTKLNLQSNLLVVDNNITTGYSLKIMVESMKKVCSNVYCGIPEVYLEEILNIAKQIKGFENKEVMISGSDLTNQPPRSKTTGYGSQPSVV